MGGWLEPRPAVVLVMVVKFPPVGAHGKQTHQPNQE